MAKLPRLHVPGGWYYVCAHGRRELFTRPADFWLFEHLVAMGCRRTGIEVHGFCWLTRSLRLLVRVEQLPVAAFMQYIGSRYARVVRQRSKGMGTLFACRYDAVLLDVQRYFLEVLCDMHLEPVRSGAARSADNYHWSSHRAYMGIEARAWLCVSFGLQLLSTEPTRARDQYDALLRRRAVGRARWPQRLSSDSRVMGDEAFLAALEKQTVPNADLARIVADICRAQCVTLEALRSRAQTRLLSLARTSIAIRALAQEIASISEVARFLHRSPSALARAVQRQAKR